MIGEGLLPILTGFRAERHDVGADGRVAIETSGSGRDMVRDYSNMSAANEFSGSQWGAIFGRHGTTSEPL